MLAFSPPSFPTFGWPLEERISHDLNYIISREPQTPQSYPYDIPSISQEQGTNFIDHSPSFAANSSDPADLFKKLNHNASERDRRKKINTLYSSLRSLLPASDQSKKLSIPATVSRVGRYIPELQQQVERLSQKKEELLAKVSRQDDLTHQINQREFATAHGSLSVVSSNWLGDKQVMVQISTYRHHNNPLLYILPSLEEEGIFLLSCSSFESFAGRVFYNLHLQVENEYKFDNESLSKKIASLYDNRELFLS